jgi:carboxymethylenebutenolidase
MCSDADASPPDLPAERAGNGGTVRTRRLTLSSADGTAVSATLASSSGTTGVVILPDVRGLYPFYEQLAERFADAGHPAIAFDYFGRTAGTGPRGDDFDYQPHVAQTRLDQLQADTAAALASLRSETGVATVAVVGFCFGGTQAFLAAGTPELGFDAAVGFYGVLAPARLPAPVERASAVRIPVLGLFGGADAAIPPEDIAAYDEALTAAAAEHEFVTYPGAPHSFFDRKYDQYAEASADSWRRVLDFLARLQELR